MIRSRLAWMPLLALLFLFSLIWMLGSTLVPFVIAAYLAYLGNPLVHAFMRYRLPRTLAVILVFSVIIFVIIGLWLLLVPMIQRDFSLFIIQLPDMLDWLNQSIQTSLTRVSSLFSHIQVPNFQQTLYNHLPQTKTVAGEVLVTITKSWNTVIAVIINILLIPVVTFYFLRDWDKLTQNHPAWFKLPLASKWLSYIKEIDHVLRTFFRGQLCVMIVLGFLYAVGLSLLQVPLSLLIGLTTGLLSLVPFLGFIVGLTFACLITLVHFHDFIHVFYVIMLFLAIVSFENVVLLPRLVGESLGLHPIAVIFAIMAGGQLFGAIGILLSLPIAAIIKVSLRHISTYLIEKSNQRTLQENKLS